MKKIWSDFLVAVLGDKTYKMNQWLKVAGIAILITVVVGGVFELVNPPSYTPAKIAEKQLEENLRKVQAETRSQESKKTIKTVSAGLIFLCLLGAYLMEPGLPKVDRRFKTGFKNNERPRQKSSQQKTLQRALLAMSLLAGLIYLAT